MECHIEGQPASQQQEPAISIAKDDLICAMPHLVAPTVDDNERAGDVDPSPVDDRSPNEVEGITAHYTGPEGDHRLDIFEEEAKSEEHDYPEAEIESASEIRSLSGSEVGMESIDYDSKLEAEEAARAQAYHRYNNPNIQVKIFRVPAAMRRENTDSYEPRFISLGPYHCWGSLEKDYRSLEKNYFLDEGQNEKWYSLNAIRLRTWFSASECAEKLKRIKTEVREHYEGEISKKWDRLEMMLDACFILYGFGILPSKHMPAMKRNLNLLERRELRDERKMVVKELLWDSMEHLAPVILPPMHSLPFKSVSFTIFTRDISLLENQIPFCILEMVYEIAMHKLQKKELLPSLRRQVAEYLHKLLFLYPTAINLDNTADDDNIPKFEHILDYYHKYFEPSEIIRESEILENILSKYYCATELDEVGIGFKNSKGEEGRSLLDIKFMNGTLEIPTLIIDGKTLHLFRNIIAYEEKLSRWDPSRNYFTAYVIFMANLIITENDLSLLIRKKIIVNHLGDYKKVTDLFSKLTEGVAIKFDSDNYLRRTCFRLDVYYTRLSNRWTVKLKRKDLKLLWLAVGIIVPACTVISAAAAVYDIIRKN